MKQLLLHKGKAGSTLVEVVVAIAILGLVTAPICSNMMVAARLNAKSRAMLAAQLRVSSAVEQLMAEGVTEKDNGDGTITLEYQTLSGLTVTLPTEEGADYKKGSYCKVTVEEESLGISVETFVKVTPPQSDENNTPETPPEEPVEEGG